MLTAQKGSEEFSSIHQTYLTWNYIPGTTCTCIKINIIPGNMTADRIQVTK